MEIFSYLGAEILIFSLYFGSVTAATVSSLSYPCFLLSIIKEILQLKNVVATSAEHYTAKFKTTKHFFSCN